MAGSRARSLRPAGLALAVLLGALAASGVAEAADAPSALGPLFMAPAKADRLIQAATARADPRRTPEAMPVLGLGQPQLGVRPEVLAYTGAEPGAAARARLADAFYRQGLVVAPGPAAASQAGAAPALIDLAALHALLGRPARACSFACIGADSLGNWLEQAPRPQL